VNLVELVEDVVPIWRMPGHAIHVQAPDELIITADLDRLQQVVENLLSNATTHADPDTPVQVVITQEQRTDGPWAIVTISNRGPAMPPEQLTSLFELFAKGAHSQGLGLGLYLAQGIAHAHQGTLTVRTEAAKTTHFTLSLPLQVTQTTPEER
jgi:two-component system, OmpR family, sensor kinase